MGSVNPSKEAFRAMVDSDRQLGPIHMINLIRYRERADYPEGHPYAALNLTGAEAYRRYGEEAAPAFEAVGGVQVWAGRPDLVLTGPTEERWDAAFIAQYPNVQAFLDMLRRPDYQQAVINRNAAVEDSRLIRSLPLAPGKGFNPA
jgi:uncharacterized protein (DUF1330 family)